MEPYERLRAWQEAHRLALGVYRVSRKFPEDERFGLTSQARRASYSVAANIVEGSAVRSIREFRRYLAIARRSLAETSYALRMAGDLGYLPLNHWKRLAGLKQRVGYLVWRLDESLAKQANLKKPRQPRQP